VARSGTQQLPTGDEGSLSPKRWYPVASVGDAGDAKSAARSVRVRVGKASYDTALYQASLPAGIWWAPDGDHQPWIGADYLGVIRFQYGYEGMLREIYCDLRSGEYQIPPCEFLRVEASRYTPAVTHGGEFPFTVDTTPYVIEGEIADGVAADFTPMMLTAKSKWGAVTAGQFAQVAAPPGAYAFEIYPSASDVDFSGNTFATREPGSVRDFVEGLWLPPSSPLPLINSHVRVSTGDVSRSCDLVFWVR
jgi:hypothetical protein